MTPVLLSWMQNHHALPALVIFMPLVEIHLDLRPRKCLLNGLQKIRIESCGLNQSFRNWTTAGRQRRTLPQKSKASFKYLSNDTNVTLYNTVAWKVFGTVKHQSTAHSFICCSLRVKAVFYIFGHIFSNPTES